MANIAQAFAERIGKIIPNEFSKLGGANKFIAAVPVIGPPIATALDIIGGVDRGATAFGDTGDLGASAGSVISGYGRGTDPGAFGSPTANTGGFSRTGQILDFIPGPSSAGRGRSIADSFSRSRVPSNARVTIGSGTR